MRRLPDYERGFIHGAKELIRVANEEFYIPKCKFCNSAHVVRFGHRKGVQRWWCKTCRRKFVDNKALPGMKTPTEQVASAISMYYEGMSLNAIRRQFSQMHNYLPSDSTIYEWIDKFRQKVIIEAKNTTPKVGDNWIADETVLKIGGKKYWLIDIMDEDTRYFIYSYISKNRSTRDIKYAFEQAYEHIKKYPKKVTTDGWKAYPDGIEQAYGANTKHELGSPFVTTDNNTNLVERLQGTVKDRTKTIRGLKTRETAEEYLEGWLVHYNYFRNHGSLGDRTPAQVAGINFPYQNWLDVVQAQKVRLSLPKQSPKSPAPVFTPPRSPRVRTPKAPRASKYSPKSGLYVSKAGAMSRHYFRGARRVN